MTNVINISDLLREIRQLREENARLRESSNSLVKMNRDLESRIAELDGFKSMISLQVELFTACFNMLDVSQEILNRIFPGVGTPYVEANGEILRMMFEMCFQQSADYYYKGFDTITFKMHSSLPQFMEFCKAFANFIFHSRIEVPGTDFLITAIHEPKRTRLFFSDDESQFAERVIFQVNFFCRKTKRDFKFQFSCDGGHYIPTPDFNVNCFTFSERKGFNVFLPTGQPGSLMRLFRCIIERNADWIEPHWNPHISSFATLLKLLKTRQYQLSGIPFFQKAECEVFHERSKCMTFSGCECTVERFISLPALRGIYAANDVNRRMIRCPLCRNPFTGYLHELPLGDNSIDVSRIDNLPTDDEIRFLKEDALSVREIYGVAPDDPFSAEILDLIGDFEKLGKVTIAGASLQCFREFGRIPGSHRMLFFPQSDDQEDLDDQEDQDDPDDPDDHEDHEDHEDQDYQDDQDYPDDPLWQNRGDQEHPEHPENQERHLEELDIWENRGDQRNQGNRGNRGVQEHPEHPENQNYRS